MARILNHFKLQAGDADSSRAPGLTSGLQGSVSVHRGALLLMSQWQCISSFVFFIVLHYKWGLSNDISVSDLDHDLYKSSKKSNLRLCRRRGFSIRQTPLMIFFIMWTNNSAVITGYILFSNKWQQYHFGILRSAPYGITAHLLINYMHINDQQDTGAVMWLTWNTPQLFRCWKLLHRRVLMIFHHAFKFCHCPIIYSAYFTNIIKDFQIENFSW